MSLLQSFKENYIKTIKESYLKSLPSQDIIDCDMELAACIWNYYMPLKKDKYIDEDGYENEHEIPLELEEKYNSINFRKTFQKYLNDESFIEKIINKTNYELIFVKEFQTDNPDIFKHLKNNKELVEHITIKDKRGVQLIDFDSKQDKAQYYIEKPYQTDVEVIKEFSNDLEVCRAYFIKKHPYIQNPQFYISDYQYVSDSIKKSVDFSLELINSTHIEIYEHFTDEMKKHPEVRNAYLDKRIKIGITLREFSSLTTEEKKMIFKSDKILDNFNIIDAYINSTHDQYFSKLLIEEFVKYPNKYCSVLNRKKLMDGLSKTFMNFPQQEKEEKTKQMVNQLNCNAPNTQHSNIIKQIIGKDKVSLKILEERFYFNIHEEKNKDNRFIKTEEQLQHLSEQVLLDFESKKITEDVTKAWISFLISSCSLDLTKDIGKQRKNSYEYIKKSYQVKLLSEAIPIKNEKSMKVKI